MYGYVLPHKPELKMQDFVLYRSFYCGLCKSTGKQFGQMPRFATNYDMTFFSVFVHDMNVQEVSFNEEVCICNPFKKKLIVKSNALLDKIAAVNIIMLYYKADDAVKDRQGASARLVRSTLKRPYKKAVKLVSEADEIVKKRYAELDILEKAGETSIDKAAEPFSLMMKELCGLLVGEDEGLKTSLCYNLGKFVYLVDALDDIDEDSKKKNYNPFLASIGGYKNRRQFIDDNRADIEFILHSATNRVIECFNGIDFTQSYDLLKNIVHAGLRQKLTELLESEKKLKNPRI